MNGLSVEERIDRGRRAADMLQDPVLADALEAAKQGFIREWLSTHEPDKQRAAWAKVHALGSVLDDLRKTLADGQIAAEALRRAK